MSFLSAASSSGRTGPPASMKKPSPPAPAATRYVFDSQSGCMERSTIIGGTLIVRLRRNRTARAAVPRGVTPTTIDTDPQTALVERLFGATLGALELFSVHLGRTLGLYDALEEPATPDELAARAGIHPRYAREWLEQQAVAGLLAVQDGRFSLPAEHAAVLCDPDDPNHVAPFAALLAGIGGVIDQVADAYRSGGGVPYAAYGTAFRHGQGGINRRSE